MSDQTAGCQVGLARIRRRPFISSLTTSRFLLIQSGDFSRWWGGGVSHFRRACTAGVSGPGRRKRGRIGSRGSGGQHVWSPQQLRHLHLRGQTIRSRLLNHELWPPDDHSGHWACLQLYHLLWSFTQLQHQLQSTEFTSQGHFVVLFRRVEWFHCFK